MFWVNLPLGALALVAGAFLVPTSRDPKQSRLDPIGAGLSIVGLASLLFGIIEGPDKGWGAPAVVAGFAIGIVALLTFVTWELRSDHPMLDMRFFKNPRFTAANSAITMTFFAMFGSMFLMTQYWQFVHGYSALSAGIRMIPYALTMMIAAPLSARAVERLGTKRVVTGGLLIIAASLFALSFITATSPYLARDDHVLRHVGRHGHDDGSGHRIRDGLAATGEGGGRLGGERHHTPGRGRTRRGGHRQRGVERLRPPHR